MNLFHDAKVVRLRSHIGNYLHANEDKESVTQHGDGSTRNVLWMVEQVPGPNGGIIRLISWYGKYLTRTNQALLLGFTGSVVIQTLPKIPDPIYVDWKPFTPLGWDVSTQAQVLLMAWPSNYVLRGSSGLWRNFVTVDFLGEGEYPQWALWEVHVVQREPQPQPRPQIQLRPLPQLQPRPQPQPQQLQERLQLQKVQGAEHDDNDDDDDDDDDDDEGCCPPINADKIVINHFHTENTGAKYGNYARGNAYVGGGTMKF